VLHPIKQLRDGSDHDPSRGPVTHFGELPNQVSWWHRIYGVTSNHPLRSSPHRCMSGAWWINGGSTV
jgi:hypothetical protein